MAEIAHSIKPLAANPLKLSAPLGAAMAFMGMEGCQPLLHGSQGCTAFALVMMVRHFREAIPLQTTAMNEVSTILGGMDHVEQALLNIVKRVKPKVIGLISTALTETRGEDTAGDLTVIRARNPELADSKIVLVSAPDYEGSLETGWSKAVCAMIETLVVRGTSADRDASKVNILPGVHLSPADIEHLCEIVEAFGLQPTVLPDLSGSLDGHVPDHFIATTLGGTSPEQAANMGRAGLTIAIGEHMRPAARRLEALTGVPFLLCDRLTGLEAMDKLVSVLSRHSGRPVPARLRRARSQLLDAMIDGHFFFGDHRFAVAGEADFLWAVGALILEMGGTLSAAVSATDAPHLKNLECSRVVIGDFQDMEDEILLAGGADLVIAGTNARLSCRKLGIAHERMGFPVYDRLGAAHRLTIGYRGSRDLILRLANLVLDQGGHSSQETDHAAAAAVD